MSGLHNGGFQYVLDQVVLPLGLSFSDSIRFAVLVDPRAGRIKRVTLRDYITFVLFPPLIAPSAITES